MPRGGLGHRLCVALAQKLAPGRPQPAVGTERRRLTRGHVVCELRIVQPPLFPPRRCGGRHPREREQPLAHPRTGAMVEATDAQPKADQAARGDGHHIPDNARPVHDVDGLGRGGRRARGEGRRSWGHTVRARGGGALELDIWEPRATDDLEQLRGADRVQEGVDGMRGALDGGVAPVDKLLDRRSHLDLEHEVDGGLLVEQVGGDRGGVTLGALHQQSAAKGRGEAAVRLVGSLLGKAAAVPAGLGGGGEPAFKVGHSGELPRWPSEAHGLTANGELLDQRDGEIDVHDQVHSRWRRRRGRRRRGRRRRWWRGRWRRRGGRWRWKRWRGRRQ